MGAFLFCLVAGTEFFFSRCSKKGLGEALQIPTRKGFAFFFFFNPYYLKALLYAKALKKKSTLMGAFLFFFVAGTGLEPVTFGL